MVGKETLGTLQRADICSGLFVAEGRGHSGWIKTWDSGSA